MKVLIYSQYYLPESPPGAHRLASLADSISKAGHSVEVLTSWPNYPEFKIKPGYNQKFYGKEIMGNIRVHRSGTILLGGKGKISRLLVYLSFQFSSVLNAMRKIEKPDVIFCLSPPITNAVGGIILKRYFKAQLVVNIADLWPESGVKLGLIKNKFLIGILERIEKKLYYEAAGIACQTNGILKNIESRFPNKKLIWFKNGVDFDFYKRNVVNLDMVELIKLDLKDFVVLYSGLVGHAQGLDVLVKAASVIEKNIDISYLIVGDGPLLEDIKKKVQANGLTNFIFVGNQPKEMMPTYLSMANICLVPLKKTDLFLGAIPSKIFDCFAMRKSILLGVDGEARELFDVKYKCAYYYEPDNEFDLANRILKAKENILEIEEMGQRSYSVVENHFDRAKINIEVIDFIASCLEEGNLN